MLEFKKIIENFDREKANNTAAQESNDKYEAAIAGELQGNEAEGRSQIVIKSISGVLQKAIPVLAEPFLSTSKPITFLFFANSTASGRPTYPKPRIPNLISLMWLIIFYNNFYTT